MKIREFDLAAGRRRQMNSGPEQLMSIFLRALDSLHTVYNLQSY